MERSGAGAGPVAEWPGLGFPGPPAKGLGGRCTKHGDAKWEKLCQGLWERGLWGAFGPARSSAPLASPVVKVDEVWWDSRGEFIALVIASHLPPRSAWVARAPCWLPPLRRRGFGFSGLRGGLQLGVGVEDLASVTGHRWVGGPSECPLSLCGVTWLVNAAVSLVFARLPVRAG